MGVSITKCFFTDNKSGSLSAGYIYVSRCPYHVRGWTCIGKDIRVTCYFRLSQVANTLPPAENVPLLGLFMGILI